MKLYTPNQSNRTTRTIQDLGGEVLTNALSFLEKPTNDFYTYRAFKEFMDDYIGTYFFLTRKERCELWLGLAKFRHYPFLAIAKELIIDSSKEEFYIIACLTEGDKNKIKKYFIIKKNNIQYTDNDFMEIIKNNNSKSKKKPFIIIDKTIICLGDYLKKEKEFTVATLF